MTRQSWNAVVAAVLFVVSSFVVALTPVPFVTRSPGTSYDLLGQVNGRPALAVEGITTYPTSGQLRFTTVNQTRVDAAVHLPDAIAAYLLPNRSVLPRAAVYRAGTTLTEVSAEEQRLMSASQEDAVVSALRLAGQPVRELPRIVTVRVSGPANGKLQPGDLVVSMDNRPVKTVDDVQAAVRAKSVGDVIVVSVLRDGASLTSTIPLVGSNNDGKIPTIGVTLDTGFDYAPRVVYGIDPSIGGGSAGLMFALAVYDTITPVSLTAGRSIAGTGTITSDGVVGAIGGAQEKISGAQRNGATVFLIPQENCADVAGIHTTMDVLSVTSLDDAVKALSSLDDPQRKAALPRC